MKPAVLPVVTRRLKVLVVENLEILWLGKDTEHLLPLLGEFFP
jgi:hypothetical protein